MPGLAAPLILVLARVRRRPVRWLAAVLGLALATAFACGVAGEATIAGDQAARVVLSDTSPLDQTVRLTAQGPGSTGRERRAGALLVGLGIRGASRVVLLNPVRLGGEIVRPAAIRPLSAWVAERAAATLGSCSGTVCSVLGTSPLRQSRLSAYGVSLRVAASATLPSPVPLGFAPGAGGGPPVVLGADPTGLDRIRGLSGVYRTESWVSLRQLADLHSWQLDAVKARWERVAATLAANSEFALSAPFDALDRARAQAAGAPQRLLLAGGGALAALAGFIVLAAYALRHERRTDVRRLASAGARADQRIAFALGEAGALAAVGLLLGAVVGVGATAALATDASLPAGRVLTQTLLTPAGAAALCGGWGVATAIVSLVLLLPSARIADVLAVAAAAALALALTRGSATGGALPSVLAPLACASAGVVVYRVAAWALRGVERLSREGPPVLRLALISLARAPAAPALAIAFIAVSTGLGGFALAYRATLGRGQADAAADRVPLDVRVTPGPSFTPPLALAPLSRWRGWAGGAVLPVRRTEASFVDGAAAVTVPALGVPASALPRMHGWRTSDGSAPLATLARRLRPPGPARTPGPQLGPHARLTLTLRASGGAAMVAADLRAADGSWRRLGLGTATARPVTLHVRAPGGHFELAALTITAPTGLEITSAHQNGESLTAATQSATAVTIGPLRILGSSGRPSPGEAPVAIGGWRAAGAAAVISPGGRATGTLRIRFNPAGNPGVIRPAQPSDSRAVAVLADPATAAVTAGGRLALSIDGLPVTARIVGTLRRFATVPDSSAGFVIADEATLAAALDAYLPGQGRPDELWIDSPRPARLRAALARAPLIGLTSSFRAQVQRRLAADPIARGVLGTLLVAALVALGLASLGLLVALLGAMRDPRAERELAVLGLGPRGLRRELTLRIASAAGLGLLAGLIVAIALARLAVSAVGAAATLGPAAPPLVTVAPWEDLALGALAVLAAFAATAWLASTIATPGRRR